MISTIGLYFALCYNKDIVDCHHLLVLSQKIASANFEMVTGPLLFHLVQ